MILAWQEARASRRCVVQPVGHADQLPPVNVLAISGGGAGMGRSTSGAGRLGQFGARAGLQRRDRRQHRRLHRHLRVPRAGLRRFHPRLVPQRTPGRHLRNADLDFDPQFRFDRVVEAVAEADRGRRHAQAAQGRGERASRPAALHRHDRPGHAAPRDLGHGRDRRQRQARGAGPVPQDHPGVWFCPWVLSAGVDRRRNRRREIPGDARGRGRRASVLVPMALAKCDPHRLAAARLVRLRHLLRQAVRRQRRRQAGVRQHHRRRHFLDALRRGATTSFAFSTWPCSAAWTSS